MHVAENHSGKTKTKFCHFYIDQDDPRGVSNTEYMGMSGVVPDRWQVSSAVSYGMLFFTSNLSLAAFSQPAKVAMAASVAIEGSEPCQWHAVESSVSHLRNFVQSWKARRRRWVNGSR